MNVYEDFDHILKLCDDLEQEINGRVLCLCLRPSIRNGISRLIGAVKRSTNKIIEDIKEKRFGHFVLQGKLCDIYCEIHNLLDELACWCHGREPLRSEREYAFGLAMEMEGTIAYIQNTQRDWE